MELWYRCPQFITTVYLGAYRVTYTVTVVSLGIYNLCVHHNIIKMDIDHKGQPEVESTVERGEMA